MVHHKIMQKKKKNPTIVFKSLSTDLGLFKCVCNFLNLDSTYVLFNQKFIHLLPYIQR